MKYSKINYARAISLASLLLTLSVSLSACDRLGIKNPFHQEKEEMSEKEQPQSIEGKSKDDDYTSSYYKCMNTDDAANGVTVAMVNCIGAEHEIQDAKLNATYKRLMDSLDPDKKPKVLAAQRAWIRFRDADCEAKNQTGGTMDSIGMADCALSATIERNRDLEKMLEQ